MELVGRADSQRLKMREVKEQLDTLEKLCETLSIDMDKLTVDD